MRVFYEQIMSSLNVALSRSLFKEIMNVLKPMLRTEHSCNSSRVANIISVLSVSGAIPTRLTSP